jgi:hypothetical protein
MEIDFNPSQMQAPRINPTVKAPGATSDSTMSEAPAPQGMAELQRKLNELALMRPEKMAAARSVIADVKYPPNELLDGISHLLAIHLKE